MKDSPGMPNTDAPVLVEVFGQIRIVMKNNERDWSV